MSIPTDTSPASSSCEARVLAQSELGHILACPECQQVHLQLRFLTLRLDAEAFRALLGMMGHAQSQIDADPDVLAPREHDTIRPATAQVH